MESASFPPPLCYRIEAVLAEHSNIVKVDTDDSDDRLCGAFVYYREVSYTAQVGPTCGLAALIMTGKLFNVTEYSLDNVLQKAKELKLTNFGEMFSASWLVKLTEELWNDAVVGEVEEFPSPERVVSGLGNEEVLLVPYDSDRNFSPCAKNGHTAHWAIVIGFFYINDKGDRIEFKKRLDEEIEAQKLYVFAFHGKSKHMSLWPYKDLLGSNQQLFEVGPKRTEGYVVPNGEMTDLRNKAVWLKPRP
ncbi:unnamed protein product [Auanema sp. JU1783]|nr:unnamed protein product [Auanema sp. JU1783]